MFKSTLTLVLLILCFAQTQAQWVILSKEADTLVAQGTKYIYNIEFEKAEQCFKKIQSLEPKNPAGYFLDAMIEWWEINMFPFSKKTDDKFLAKIEKVIQLSDALLEKEEYDLTGLFFKGAALGYRARLYAQRNSWLDAASDGKTAFDIMSKCYERAPNNHDIMMGTGIYNYFAEAIPEKMPLLKPIVLFFPKGNKKIGILQLKSSATYARYTRVEAMTTLMQINYSFEENMNEAYFYSKQLKTSYPNNPYFHKYFARCLVRMGEWDSLEVQWREIVNRTLNKQKGYDNPVGREGCYYVGLALDRKGNLEMALKYLLKCEEISKYIADDESGFRASANLKIGLIYDKLGKRDLAIKQYKLCLNLKDFQDVHEKAEKYLKVPYR